MPRYSGNGTVGAHGVNAVAGNGQATVWWTAPSDGGSAISSYTVTPYVGGVAQAPQTFTASATSQVVSGLTNGTSYTFRVTATNAVGPSPPSAPSGAVAPIAPSLSITGGAQAGRPEQGDQIIVTYSPAPTPSAFYAAWSTTSHPTLDDSNVVVTGTQPASGDDTMTVSDPVDCSGGFTSGPSTWANGGISTTPLRSAGVRSPGTDRTRSRSHSVRQAPANPHRTRRVSPSTPLIRRWD